MLNIQSKGLKIVGGWTPDKGARAASVGNKKPSAFAEGDRDFPEGLNGAGNKTG